ncbi:ABC transporter [Kytococcus schroeteri]|uniref:ABC transporter n=2 Tax=Kytococcus TaxID=57499 RepID=A0A2I1PCS8_9MICO|nr:ABC transporter ATP-binding protein [Kytococcus schroeteri]PKZ42391.1 ABC transporter [Kytococcus schroeteri]
MTTVLRLRGVGYTHPGAASPAVAGVDLDLVAGRTTVVLGPSGSGKSTLLRVAAGLLEPTTGTVERHPAARRPAVAFQEPALLPWLTVEQNLVLGTGFRANRGAGHLSAGELLAELGIEHLADARVDEVSGGQAQRTAIGRALAVDPEVLLLDEPLGALDPATRDRLQGWLADLLAARSVAALLVTHDVPEAVRLGDEIVHLDGARGVTGRWTRPADDAGRVALERELAAHYARDVAWAA